ncbi:hypothetical protein [Novosphingobium sp.]|uniref:hypothetical protein n=1 Tax=Novosphingobium sp. TaxID=1874826 RepID=UPI0025E1FB9B|nr:hypothetical protein [Novosphingobium sp.]
MALLDGAITTIRQKMEGEPENEELDRIVAGLENTIDHVTATNPGMVVPRNGTFGRAADAGGLGAFTKPI